MKEHGGETVGWIAVQDKSLNQLIRVLDSRKLNWASTYM